jgi:UDP-N-acetylglucosamine 4,6-dehydratase/5-epimerase
MKKISLTNATILITGGTGSWGQELVRQIFKKYNPKQIRIYSRGEHKQVEMKRTFQDPRLTFYIGDVRDKNRLMLATKHVDIIYHLAALKHVPVCEENPWEAVQTNVIGTQNIIECAIENKVKKVLDISTDKAVDPLNIYGVTKACGEKLIIAANLISSDTKFVCIRGGNVTGTNGSVVPLFKEQIAKLNSITLTDTRMTRFFMNLNEAIELVLKATLDSVGGEVLVMKMPAMKITDLAKVMIKELGNKDTKMTSIGIRPGEKIYEVLVSRYEMIRTYDIGKYFVILPQIPLPETITFYERKKLAQIKDEEFNSNNTTLLSQKDIKQLLKEGGWFDNTNTQEASTYLSSLNKSQLKHFFKSEGWTRK